MRLGGVDGGETDIEADPPNHGTCDEVPARLKEAAKQQAPQTNGSLHLRNLKPRNHPKPRTPPLWGLGFRV